MFGVELFNTELGKRLKNWGIDLNGAENGVLLPTIDFTGRKASLHRGRTSKAYNDEIMSRLALAGSRDDALDILQQIREDLLNGSLSINGAQ